MSKPAEPLSQALTDLQSAVADSKSTEKQLKDQLAIVRAAREKARKETNAAQKELLQVLTKDQEAALLSLGYLD